MRRGTASSSRSASPRMVRGDHPRCIGQGALQQGVVPREALFQQAQVGGGLGDAALPHPGAQALGDRRRRLGTLAPRADGRRPCGAPRGRRRPGAGRSGTRGRRRRPSAPGPRSPRPPPGRSSRPRRNAPDRSGRGRSRTGARPGARAGRAAPPPGSPPRDRTAGGCARPRPPGPGRPGPAGPAGRACPGPPRRAPQRRRRCPPSAGARPGSAPPPDPTSLGFDQPRLEVARVMASTVPATCAASAERRAPSPRAAR
jgi:hypothetical protein